LGPRKGNSQAEKWDIRTVSIGFKCALVASPVILVQGPRLSVNADVLAPGSAMGGLMHYRSTSKISAK